MTLVREVIRLETNQINYYIKNRYVDITSIVTSGEVFEWASYLKVTGSIYLLSLHILILPIMVILDYLNNSFFYKETPWSSSLQYTFIELDRLQNYQPILTNEDREELIKDPNNIETVEEAEKIDKQSRKEHEAYKIDPRPVILFLKAKSDHNGALNLGHKDNVIIINGDNNKGVQELKKKYKFALIDNVTCINDIKMELEKITNPIQQLWFLAHGTPTSMQLEGEAKIENSDIDKFSNLLQQKLSKDAHVVLYSCSTGAKVISGENIATKFSKVLPGRTIWAPKIPTGYVTLDVGKNYSTKVCFLEYKSRLKFLAEKIWNICCLRPFKKIEIQSNVTAEIKDGK